jgi:hypothetical protein
LVFCTKTIWQPWSRLSRQQSGTDCMKSIYVHT